ncbi:ParB/RepB/Spo0J family partition protein [Botrimarina sp.]|uniref:ParB/RepB/Spo0J family partition protein n=1 Tax=Botrimarina sp. TaxID=2795802 RepID=UPI0032EF87AA
MSNQRRLGRGLEALLGRSLEEGQAPIGAATPLVPAGAAEPANTSAPGSPEPPPATEEAAEDDGVMTRDQDGQRWLDLGVIEPNPYQPRKRFDEEEIADLADSIREHGVLQPLVVRRVDGRFELIAGERRLRAAQAAGWQRVPVQVRDVDDRQTAELAIVENLQRKDLNPIEKATSFERYLREYGCTQEELAARVHINRSTVANLVRLLDLPDDVKSLVVEGELSQGHARALLGLPGDEQSRYAKRVVGEGLSVRRTEELVQEHGAAAADDELRVVGQDGVSRPSAPTRGEQLAALETELTAALGVKVKLTQNAKGAGKVTLHFADGEAFERLRSVLTAVPKPAAEAA